MSMLYCEDAYGLGLLYAYIHAGKKMVLKEDLDKFHEIIEFNLRKVKMVKYIMFCILTLI